MTKRPTYYRNVLATSALVFTADACALCTAAIIACDDFSKIALPPTAIPLGPRPRRACLHRTPSLPVTPGYAVASTNGRTAPVVL
jgi:hypothetical protein